MTGSGAARLVADIQRLLETRWLARELHGLDETDSTNRVATEHALSGAAHGTTILAEAQSRGRGRHGRSFFSPAGRNLYTSIVLSPDEAGPAPTTVLAAGLAVAQTAAAALGAPERVSIKWPNDVQIDGRKTSGILMEAVPVGDRRVGVLGIGINLNLDRSELPVEFRDRATSLSAALGAPVDRAAFAARLYGTLEAVLDLHQRSGFEGVRAAFDGFFQMRGEEVRVADLEGRVQVTGKAVGIGADGSLRVACADGREERVLAGDVTVVKEPVR